MTAAPRTSRPAAQRAQRREAQGRPEKKTRMRIKADAEIPATMIASTRRARGHKDQTPGAG